jgi:unsaturated rhamnogalacturonyl hydrolase
MFAYALARGARAGHLRPSYLEHARRAFAGVAERHVRVGAGGEILIGGICKVAGLGGDPYRDGSYEYYLSEPVVTNDDKGVGAFLLAAAEVGDEELRSG